MENINVAAGSRLKRQLWESPRYGKWIRQSGEIVCVITKTRNPVNHHLIGHGYSATGMKAPDLLQIALSHKLHTELHDKGWKAFELKYGRSQWSMVAETALTAHINHFFDLKVFYESREMPRELYVEICRIIGVPECESNEWDYYQA